jgi:AGZA family xanthine/uracil permease-like MFS transporter
LHARRVRGSIILGIMAATAFSIGLKFALPHLGGWVMAWPPVRDSLLLTKFTLAQQVVALPHPITPTLCKLDLVGALSLPMLPFILIFLFMVLFDTLGTLMGVAEQAGLIRDNRLPRARQALMSDAVGTVAGAALGTSTVTSFIESAAGVEQGGRTGLTALCAAALFLLALFFSPIVDMIGSYRPITAPALVVVGTMMMRNVVKIDWKNYAESLPSFLIIAGIPLSFSIADGLALGFIAYPLVKLLSGQGREVKWLMYVMAAVLVAYFVLVRAPQAA